MNLDGGNRATVIAEALARAIAAIRVAGVRWRAGRISTQNAEICPRRPYIHCAAIRITQLAFICLTFVPREIAEQLARVHRVR